MTDPVLVLEPVASAVHKLSVLLAAGVTPASSWQYLAEQSTGRVTVMLETVGGAARRGESVSDAILAAVTDVPDARMQGRSRRRSRRTRAGAPPPAEEIAAWRGVAAAWRVATDAGAPLAPTLREFSASLRSLAQIQRDLRVALAGPVATARMVMALPAVGVFFGLALGFDTVGTLFTTVPGLVCLVLGVGLMGGARAWNGHLVRGAKPTDFTPGLSLDLMAIAVSGGASLPRATAAVTEARESCGLPDDGGSALEEVLELSQRAGVPAAALLRSEADEARRAARSEGDRRAATLAVTLMLPLGICVLPAFMLLGVAPLLIAVISSTVETF